MDLEVVFDSPDLIAINKPHGLLVHRTSLAKDATEFALQKVREIVGHRVYPTHRLDRKTSGVLLFAKNEQANQDLQKLFRERQVRKEYLAIVRGYLSDKGTIDYPLTNEGKTKEAVSHYTCLEHFEINLPSGSFPTSRYSLVLIKPKTGRYHQIRKHFAHIMHPILGDRPHGCNKQNRLWKEKYDMDRMILHASSLSFDYMGEQCEIKAKKSDEFERVEAIMRNGS